MERRVTICGQPDGAGIAGPDARVMIDRHSWLPTVCRTRDVFSTPMASWMDGASRKAF